MTRTRSPLLCIDIDFIQTTVAGRSDLTTLRTFPTYRGILFLRPEMRL